MALTNQSSSEQLSEFFQKLYRDETGYVYLGFKTVDQNGKQLKFEQEFYKWPDEAGLIQVRIQTETTNKEVYFGPALYKTPNDATKVNIHGSYCYWSEFDGTIPSELGSISEPSIRIQSGLAGHEHWYWFVDRFLSVPEIEQANRRITYALGADVSGWDSTQVLRPPGTFNHKRNEPVLVLSLGNSVHLHSFTESLDDPPALVEIPVPDAIPAVEDVIASCTIPARLFQLFKNGLPEGHRSEGLMALAFGFGEIKPMLTNEALLSVLLNADERWGKFNGRPDRLKRLLDIISKVRVQFPYVEATEAEIQEQEESEYAQKFGFISILQVETKIDWIWEGFLHRKGYLLLTGAPGVGKSQMSLNFACNAALGKDYLGRSVGEPRRVGFLSLEMGLEELQQFVSIQTQGYSREELSILEENIQLYPFGEPLYLSEGNEKNRKFVESLIGDESLDGIIIDSLGSTTPDDLTSEKVRSLLDWNDSLRKRRDCFTWYVHHHRKPNGDNKRPNKLADVYGSMYITARATTVLCLWESNGALSLIPLKIRLSRKPNDIALLRDSNLHYTVNESGIAVVSSGSGPRGIRVVPSGDTMPLLQNKSTLDTNSKLEF